MAELTPMMKQYFEVKEQYPDTILLFRLGDFYEMFFEDAKTVSAELDLVLTGRDCGQPERAPMCGVPYHSADNYIARLVGKGYKVAICEQTEDPAQAKGLVRREVTRVLTPGTVIENSMLDESRNNFLACVFVQEEQAGLVFADVSTGSVHVTQLKGAAPDKKKPLQDSLEEAVLNEIGRFMPSELLYNAAFLQMKKICAFLSSHSSAIVQELPASYYDLSVCEEKVRGQFCQEQLEAVDEAGASCAVRALGAALQYLREVQKNELENIKELDFYTDSNFMRLDVATLRNLEVLETLRSREKKGSLLWVLDKTKTSMGRRMLRGFLESPLRSLALITKRHNAVGELLANSNLRQDLHALLSNIHDMERLMTRIVYGTANARELRSLAQTASWLPHLIALLEPCAITLLGEIRRGIDPLEDVYQLIESAICEEPPFSVREGGLIQDGFHSELDELRDIVQNCRGYIAQVQQSEQDKTGIKKLKIGYNRVFGYYIEITNGYKELVPEHYIRKQTLANCERYITQELKELEAKVLSAQERIVRLEYELFEEIRSRTAQQVHRIQRSAAAVAQLDVLCSFAQAAAENQYVCPDMRADAVIEIRDGRHPVVEKMLNGAPFVPNDSLLDNSENRCAIITGPNMAGKSTYMRQVAIIVLMAQAGCFVPASAAQIGIVDAIFTRIGASDDLAAGQSTFMVEMNEVAHILVGASHKSLLIFDEIGRGTSTYDGMSIARAVLEYTADVKKLGARTLFATHYHELTELEGSIEGIKNYNIAVKKRGDTITFLRRIIRGGADGSYGIEVAKLAGVPDSVVSRAKVVLRELETAEPGRTGPLSVPDEPEEAQLSFASGAQNTLLEELRNLDVNTLTPIEALGKLYSIAEQAKGL